jgi:hypothetical protein
LGFSSWAEPAETYVEVAELPHVSRDSNFREGALNALCESIELNRSPIQVSANALNSNRIVSHLPRLWREAAGGWRQD